MILSEPRVPQAWEEGPLRVARWLDLLGSAAGGRVLHACSEVKDAKLQKEDLAKRLMRV